MTNGAPRSGKVCTKGHQMDPGWEICPYCEAEAKALQRAPVNVVIQGRYEVISLLGEGASAKVYRARDKAIEREVVLRAFHAGPTAPSIVRIQREAMIYGRIDHPLITRLYDVFVDNDQVYLVLSYVPGTPLSKSIDERNIRIVDAYHYACDILTSLSYLHSINIIHRDIKPSNILITEKDHRAIISDFGIGKLTDTESFGMTITQVGQPIGTPVYMAAELMANQSATPSSDVYSAGVVIFEMLTMRLPYTAQNMIALIDKVRSEPVPPIRSLRSAVPVPMEELVTAMLSKDPSVRPSAKESLDALKAMGNLDWTEVSAEDKRVAPSRPLQTTARDAVMFETLIGDGPAVKVEGFLANGNWSRGGIREELLGGDPG